jgi:hypothetical protein
MTIKQQGGIFGRNPTFNNVTVDGVLTVDQIIEKTGAAGITLDGVTLKDGNVVLADGKGIDFSATPGTGTSELFDDYEEGTWTPTVTSAAGTVTLDDATGSFYTKIGRTVQVYVRLGISTDASVGTSDLTIGGLPYAVTGVGTGNLIFSNASALDYGTGGANGLVFASGSSISHVVRTVDISSRSTFFWLYYAIYTAS